MFRNNYTAPYHGYTFAFNVDTIVPLMGPQDVDNARRLMQILVQNGAKYILIGSNLGAENLQKVREIWGVDFYNPLIRNTIFRVPPNQPKYLELRKRWHLILGMSDMRQLFYVDIDPRTIQEAAIIGFQAVEYSHLLKSDVQQKIADARYNIQMVPRQGFRYGWVI